MVNSRRINDANPMRSGYGNHLVEQNNALAKMEMLVLNLHWAGKRAKLPFEHGILANIRAIRDLRNDLLSEGFAYILTCRMNQDCVENSFSCLRYDWMSKWLNKWMSKWLNELIMILMIDWFSSDHRLNKQTPTRKQKIHYHCLVHSIVEMILLVPHLKFIWRLITLPLAICDWPNHEKLKTKVLMFFVLFYIFFMWFGMLRLFETRLECSWKSRLHQGGHEHHLCLGRSLGARLSLQKDQREDAGHQTWSEGEQVPWLWLHHKQGTVIFIYPWFHNAYYKIFDFINNSFYYLFKNSGFQQ